MHHRNNVRIVNVVFLSDVIVRNNKQNHSSHNRSHGLCFSNPGSSRPGIVHSSKTHTNPHQNRGSDQVYTDQVSAWFMGGLNHSLDHCSKIGPPSFTVDRPLATGRSVFLFAGTSLSWQCCNFSEATYTEWN